jgi:lysophospholipase L1-like esterase
MKSASDLASNQTNSLFSYLTGLLTATLIFSLIFLFIGYKIGFSDLYTQLKNEIIPPKVLRLPKDILEELTQLKAAIGNANNPTKLPEHDTFLVRPDKELGFVLRPDVRISVSMLQSTKALNVDPPVLHLKDDDNPEYSNRLKAYIEEESRINYSYSTDSNGFRKTVPEVKSDKQILIIGDSVAFGVGVDDEHTAASQLQKTIGEQYRIINGGVGNYNGRQAFLMAKKLSDENNFAGLIYIACQNDFMQAESWVGEAKDVLTEINTISDRFNNNIIIMLETYMEYTLHDFFLDTDWSDKRIEETHSLRRSLPKITAEFGFEYYDWTETVSNFMKKEKSIFSRFALYSDHAHMSPLGNRLMANELFSIIQHKWLVNSEHPNN